MKEVAERVQANMTGMDLDPSGNCFLVARALQILAAGGELVECHLQGDHHVIYQDVDGLFWDLTAHGIVGGELQLGVAELPEEYTDLTGYEWPEDYSGEFADDLLALTR